MKYEEESIDWLIATMCRGFAEYDGNEIVQQTEGDCADRHTNSCED